MKVNSTHELTSMYTKWEDKRHIEGNEGRNISCKSKHVDWTTEGQFWVPIIDVWDTIELVRRSTTLVKRRFFTFILQSGYLAEQKKPESAGGRTLKYDLEDGMFSLTTVSHAKIKCEMNFWLYPFDTQTCLFRMRIDKEINQQVQVKVNLS